MAACMILLAAPKLAASMPTDDLRSLALRQEDEPVPAIIVEDDEEVPVPTPQAPTPQPGTPSGSVTPVVPAEPEVYYAVQGCYAEPKKGRALDHVWVHQSMTPELCAAHAVDYAYYGIEYGVECWYVKLQSGLIERFWRKT